jgi:hypothetical protein
MQSILQLVTSSCGRGQLIGRRGFFPQVPHHHAMPARTERFKENTEIEPDNQ